MPCYVGMTSDPQRREGEHRQNYPQLRNFSIITEYQTKELAQASERIQAHILGCRQHPGGREPEFAETWYVYTFDY